MKKFLKKVYEFIPLKREVYSVIRSVWTPGKLLYRHLHFKGVFTVPIDESRSFKINHYGYQIENEIFWNGLTNGWEKESVKWWIRLCEYSTVIFDIGANTGLYSLIAKAVNPHSRVFAFEPVPRVFRKLQENIRLNSFDIVSIEKAASNYDGMAIIFDTLSEHIYSVTVNKNLLSADTKVIESKIETTTLNSFIRENGIKHIDLIKIDVETHEPEVLEGCSDYLASSRPTILIEILSDEVAERITKIICELGYLYFNIDERGTVRQVEKLGRSDYYNFLLCQPNMAVKLGLTKNAL